jgi:hypothetical protein
VAIPVCVVAFLFCSVAFGLARRTDFEALRSLLRQAGVGKNNRRESLF